MDLTDVLTELIEKLKEPLEGQEVWEVYRQGTAPPPPLPDTFWCYWNLATDGVAYYDDDRGGRVEHYMIYLYGKNGSPIALRQAMAARLVLLESEGWTAVGLPMDIPAESGYIGLGLRLAKRVSQADQVRG